MKTNQEYKNAALAALKGNWAPAVLMTVILFAIAAAFISPQYFIPFTVDVTAATGMSLLFGLSGAYMLACIFLIYPLNYIGYYNSCRLLYENGDDQMVSILFSLTFKNFWHNLWVCLLMMIKIFLWALCSSSRESTRPCAIQWHLTLQWSIRNFLPARQ